MNKTDPWYAKNRVSILQKEKVARQARTERITPEELQACLADPTLAWSIRGGKWIVCLECGALKEQLGHHLRVEHRMTAEEYKRKPGPDGVTPRLNKHASLTSLDVRQTHSASTKRFQRRHGAPQGFEARRRKPSLKGLADARRSQVFSLQARMNHQRKMLGKAQPRRWGRFRGTVVTSEASDWTIATMRLAGEETARIARTVKLSRFAVEARLRRMHFPSGRACLFYRGAPVTGQFVIDLRNDFRKSTKELAELLAMWPTHLSYYAARPEKILSAMRAQKLLMLRRSLVERYRHQSSAGLQGGRPQLLLPSERKSLRAQYKNLLQELKPLLKYIENETADDKVVDLPGVQSWVFRQARQRQLRMLATWPSFFQWIGNKAEMLKGFLRGSLKPFHLAYSFLSSEYKVSVGTIRDAVRRKRE